MLPDSVHPPDERQRRLTRRVCDEYAAAWPANGRREPSTSPLGCVAEVLGRYSNLGTPGVRLQKAREAAESECRSEPWKSPELRGVTRVRRIVTEQIAQMVEDYEAGMGCVVLARKYGFSDNTVLTHLKAAGVELRPRGKLTPEQADELVRLRQDGWKMQALADRYGVSRTAVSLRLNAQTSM